MRRSLIVLPLVGVLLLVACRPAPTLVWVPGQTHGVILEPGAGRVSLAIWRDLSSFLHDRYRKQGLRSTQDLIWANGKPPSIHKTISFRGHSHTVSFGVATAAGRAFVHHAVYSQDADLSEALRAAKRSRDCLAITLLSHGSISSNWTHKSNGCH